VRIHRRKVKRGSTHLPLKNEERGEEDPPPAAHVGGPGGSDKGGETTTLKGPIISNALMMERRNRNWFEKDLSRRGLFVKGGRKRGMCRNYKKDTLLRQRPLRLKG